MTYATVEDVQARMNRIMTTDEQAVCQTLLEDSAVVIDAYNACAKEINKFVVSCRMVVRAMGDGGEGIPLGATQGSMSALGYTQSWTIGSGTAGELYLNKVDKKLLGTDKIGSYSPIERLVP